MGKLRGGGGLLPVPWCCQGPPGLTEGGLLPALLHSRSEDRLQRSSAEAGGRVHTGVRACPSPATLQSFPSRGACPNLLFLDPYGPQVPGQGQAGDTSAICRSWRGNGNGHTCTLTQHCRPLTAPHPHTPHPPAPCHLSSKRWGWTNRHRANSWWCLEPQMTITGQLGSRVGCKHLALCGGCGISWGMRGFQTAQALQRE